MGGFPEDRASAFPERHLGLRTANEDAVAQALFDAWGRLASEWLDLDSIVSLARSAPPLSIRDDSAAARHGKTACRIGVAWDDAFHFYYEDNLARLESLGAEIVKFAPTRDSHLPQVDGLYFGGGYPETMARELSSNRAMLDAIRNFASAGRPIYAECGGLMYLADGIRTLDGVTWPMLGLVPGVAAMAPRLQALGYAEVETRAASILGPAGTRFRGHQFRYSTLEGAGGEGVKLLYKVHPRWGADFEEGYARANVLASYVHAHWASNPAVAEALVRACARKA